MRLYVEMLGTIGVLTVFWIMIMITLTFCDNDVFCMMLVAVILFIIYSRSHEYDVVDCSDFHAYLNTTIMTKNMIQQCLKSY